MNARKWLWLLVIPAAVALVALLFHRVLGRFDAADVLASIQAIPPYHIVFSGLFAAASYGCLTMFDLLGIRYVERDVPYRTVALISFASLAIGHNIGFAALSSGAIRYRFYSVRGLVASEIVMVIVFCGVTVGLGLSLLGGLAFCIRPGLSAEICHISPSLAAGAGAACLLAPTAYILLCTVVRRRSHSGPDRSSCRRRRLPSGSLSSAP